MSLAAKIVLAIVLFVAGFAGGIKYHVGVVAARDLKAQTAQQSDAKQQRKFNDLEAGKQAATLDNINNQLGNAREKIAQLSGRECLDADTVRVLNAVGSEPVRAAPSEPASTSTTFATDRDVGSAFAVCRARYAEISGQLNSILDIEDRRVP